MTVPYTLLVIKPMSIGRGDGPKILAAILDECPVVLHKFRAWSICDTTLFALTQDKGPHTSNLDYAAEQIHCSRYIDSWVCVFTHKDRVTDPTPLLETLSGPLTREKCVPGELRYKFGGFSTIGKTAHISDTVVHIAKPERAEYEANILFLDFDEDTL